MKFCNFVFFFIGHDKSLCGFSPRFTQLAYMMAKGGSYHTLVRATQNAAAVKKGLSVIGPEFFSLPLSLSRFSFLLSLSRACSLTFTFSPPSPTPLIRYHVLHLQSTPPRSLPFFPLPYSPTRSTAMAPCLPSLLTIHSVSRPSPRTVRVPCRFTSPF